MHIFEGGRNGLKCGTIQLIRGKKSQLPDQRVCIDQPIFSRKNYLVGCSDKFQHFIVIIINTAENEKSLDEFSYLKYFALFFSKTYLFIVIIFFFCEIRTAHFFLARECAAEAFYAGFHFQRKNNRDSTFFWKHFSLYFK